MTSQLVIFKAFFTFLFLSPDPESEKNSHKSTYKKNSGLSRWESRQLEVIGGKRVTYLLITSSWSLTAIPPIHNPIRNAG